MGLDPASSDEEVEPGAANSPSTSHANSSILTQPDQWVDYPQPGW
jgi:hypothetical protein